MKLVMNATDATTVHAGHSRYFVPPPFELVSSASIALFANSTAAPAERSYYFDVGINQTILLGLTIGLDG